MIKTTIVVPNYNGIKYLKNCIDKLLVAKDCGDFEILLVDNGSTDGSEMLCREYETQGIAKVIAFNHNTGFCGAVNAGIDACKTEYVLLLNNDTEVTKDFVVNLEHFMDTHPKAFSASAKMLSLQNRDVIDDCGDLYCALGWAFGLGKVRIGHIMKKMPKFLLPAVERQFTGWKFLIELVNSTKIILLIWKTLISDIGRKYMVIGIIFAIMQLFIMPAVVFPVPDIIRLK